MVAPAVTASLPRKYNQVTWGGGGGGNVRRTNIRPICIWQIKDDNEKRSYFVSAELQQQDNLKDNISLFPSNIIWDHFSDLSFLV